MKYIWKVKNGIKPHAVGTRCRHCRAVGWAFLGKGVVGGATRMTDSDCIHSVARDCCMLRGDCRKS